MTETIEGLASKPISRRGAMLGFGAGASLAAMPWIARAESETIRIGFPVPLTGPYAAEARDQVKSAELAVKLINDKGGGGGRKSSCWCATTSSMRVKPRPARSN